jgi:hypothetical protein
MDAPTDTSNVFDGCLSVIKDKLTTKLPEGKSWTIEMCIKGLVGLMHILFHRLRKVQHG